MNVLICPVFRLNRDPYKELQPHSSDNLCLQRVSSFLHEANSYSSFKIHFKPCFCRRDFPEPLVPYLHSTPFFFPNTHHTDNYFLNVPANIVSTMRAGSSLFCFKTSFTGYGRVPDAESVTLNSVG